jgi:hypothetical protein
MPRKVIVVIGIMLCFSMVSCNLFKTRTPQEPTQSSANYIPPTDPEKVLENMMNAFNDKNSVNYLKSFSDISFTFEANGEARTRYGGLFLTWNKSAEERYFLNLINHLRSNSSIALTFDKYPNSSGDSSQVETNYEIMIPLVESAGTKKFYGQANFTLIRDQSGNWFIKSWSDVVSHTDSTWSDLKGVYY